MNIIVFEGVDEVLVVAASKVNAFINDWFLQGQRNMDEYDVYLTDATKGFQIVHSMKFHDDDRKDFDVIELMPHDLRQKLIDAKLLIDE